MESNPDIFNELMTAIGVEGQTTDDIFDLDSPQFLPEKLLAVIFLFPSKIARVIPEGVEGSEEVANKCFFLNQVDALDDACGTIALVHALANSRAQLTLQEGSALADYIAVAQSKASALERGTALATHPAISQAHFKLSQEGQTAPTEEGVSSGHHFVCLLNVDGHLVELDGMTPGPRVHQKLPPQEPEQPNPFAVAALELIKKTIALNPDAPDISAIHLGSSA